MGKSIPVDSVLCTMVQGEAKLEVEVQHIHPIGISKGPAVEVSFDHIITQLRGLVLNLR